jgi:non-specific serine/threonine protein kinase
MFERIVGHTRAAAPAGRFEAGLAEGRGLSEQQAIASGLAASAAPVPAPSAARPLLTTREREVAALVAQGRSNRQIAAMLVVSERTVDTHLERIFNKLGVNARAQVGAWAAAQGLLAMHDGV